MLPFARVGERGPLLVMLHWLGGDSSSWTAVSHVLSQRGMRCAALDLPGFGRAANTAGYSVAAMADAVVETVRSLRFDGNEPWLLAGHSMGGKVAAVVARRALDGEGGLDRLHGLLLMSASPPGPEPMGENKRSEMLASLGESTGKNAEDRARAKKFVESNTGKLAIPPMLLEQAIDAVLRMSRTAFRAWMEHGSNEDWRDRVGVLDLPSLVFAGTEDAALGPGSQREHTLPHLPRATTVVLKAAGHLLPLERPGIVAEYVTQFVTDIGLRLPVVQSAPGSAFAGLIASERTSPETRRVMEARLTGAQDWNATSAFFTAAEFRTLRALVGRVVPEAGWDVAASLDAQLAEARGDGWRFADLPPDGDAWRCGLASLDAGAGRAHGVEFAALFPDQQDGLLQEACAGELGRGILGTIGVGNSAEAFSAEAMQQWFEDVRARCAQTYVADPRGMERVGFTGFADDMGFTQVQLGQREDFER